MRRSILISALAALALTASPALGLTPRVRDDAGFFSSQAIAAADEMIQEIKRRTGKDLLIETFTHPPAGTEAEARSTNHRVKDQFFASWAVRRARELGVDGIYVLVCRDPAYVKVAVGNQTRKVFTDADRDRLGNILVTRFKAKKFDDGLLEGVRSVRSVLGSAARDRDGGRGEQPGPAPGRRTWLPSLGGWLCLGAVVLLVLMAVFGVIRSLSGGFSGPGGYGPGGYGPGGYGYGGGGGFLPSLLGGIFGAAAGNWIYDSFFGGHHAPPPAPPTTGPDGGGMGPDTDYTAGGGGDFGSDRPAEAPDNDFGGGGSFDESGSGGDFGGGGDGFSSGGGGEF